MQPPQGTDTASARSPRNEPCPREVSQSLRDHRGSSRPYVVQRQAGVEHHGARRKFAPEEKIRIVLEGLRGEQSISELCRREGIASNLYYRWSKDFLEAGKKQLAGDTVREATSDEVKDLRSENRELKEVVAEITLKNRILKKSLTGHGEEDDT